MDRSGISTTPASGASERPTWLVALIAMAALFVISEITYLSVGMVAKASIDGGATAHDGLVGALSNAFFMNSVSESGAPTFMLKALFGLPGFNNLFFLLFSPPDPARLIPFTISGLAAPLVGMLALFGHLELSSRRGVMISLLSALLFAVVWVVLYTCAESSIFGDDVWSQFWLHVLEFPTAFISLLAVSFVLRRRV